MVSMQVTVPSSSRISGASWSWAVPEVAAVGLGTGAIISPTAGIAYGVLRDASSLKSTTWVHRQDIRVQILTHCLFPPLWSQ